MRVYPPKKSNAPCQRQELTEFQKGQIVEARALRKSYTEIGDELNIPPSTVASFLQRCKQRDSTDNLPQPGRPRATSESHNRYIIHMAESNARILLTELHDITNSKVSVQTICRRLQEDHICKWRAVKRALLTKEHVNKRLKWAREHRHWIRKDWERVCWWDECAVQKDSDSRQMWVFRHQNKREKYAPENVRGRAKGGELFQMIWECFTGTKLGPIVFVDGRVNMDVYIALLQASLLPFIDAVRDAQPRSGPDRDRPRPTDRIGSIRSICISKTDRSGPSPSLHRSDRL